LLSVRCVMNDYIEPPPPPPPTCNGVEYDDKTQVCEGNIVKTLFKDTRDNKVYKSVVIGTQTWMAENLNYDTKTTGSACYNNDESKCGTYGRLYDWATAMGSSASSNQNPSGVQGVCPVGWHLPSDAEWGALMQFVNPACTGTFGSCADAGTKLKANSSLWETNTGTDNYGFSALPGGYGSASGSFYNVGNNGYWWSSTQYNASYAYDRDMYNSNANVDRDSSGKTLLLSVRCAKD